MSSRHLLVIVLVLVSLLGACAEQRAPINRVQPNVVRKVDLAGEWYFQQTVIDMDTSANYSVVGDNAFWNMERVRWDIQESYLYARRSFEWVENSDNTTFDLDGARDNYSGATMYEDGTPYMGAVVAAFRIESHFDIQRQYNPTTGEEVNVVVENTTDRPWHQREYMRVDWAENLATDFDFDYFYYSQGELRVDPIAFYVQDNGPPEYRPLFEYDESGELGYFDFVTQTAVHPGTTYYEYWDAEIPTCWFFADAAVDCATTVMTVRNSFLRVDDEGHDFEPIEFKGRITEVFGFWTTDRMRVDHREGLREYQRRRFAQVHDIWDRAHTDEVCQSDDDCPTRGSRCDDNVGLQIGLCEVPWDERHFDQDCDSDRDCTLPGSACERRSAGAAQCTIPDVAQYTSRTCDLDSQCPETRCLAAGRCTIPYAARTPSPIVFYKTGGWPEDLAGVFATVESEWDYAFRRAVAAAQGHNRPETVRQMFYLCHSPVRPGDPAECGPEGRVVRPGDIRYNQLYYSREWNPLSPLGQSPTAPDPLTGRIFGTQITLYDAHDMLAQRVIETCRLLTGELDPTSYVNGLNLRSWVADMAVNRREAGGAARGSAADGRELSEEDVAAIYRARSNGWMRRLGLGGESSFRPEGYGHELLPQMMDRLRRSGAFDADRDPGDGFLHSLHRSPIESLLMNDEVLMMGGFAPDMPLTRDVLAEASPLSPEYRVNREVRRRWVEAHNFGRNITYVDMTNLAHEALARRIEGMDDEEAFSYVREQIYLSTIIHELGHGMGMFHNFTGSEDTVNFPEEWWALRTDNFTRRPGPRTVDPVTEAEIAGGLAEIGYSSVMDYSANYALGLTLGRYDLAAILFAYGRSVEVYRELQGLTPNDLDEYWSGRGTHLVLWSSGPQSYHYTEFYNRMGRPLFEETNREIVSVDGLQPDLMSWRDPDDERAPVRYRVPYLFCSDYGADLGENCHRWDFGYDVYDRMQYYLTQEAFWYLQANFRRGSISSDEEGFVNRVYERYYDRFKQMHDYYNLIEALLYQSYWETPEVVEPFMTDMHVGWGAYTVAIHDAFNHLARTIAWPHTAWYDTVTRADGTRMFFDTGWSGGDLIELPVMEGRYYTTTWWVPGDSDNEYDCGLQFWECLHHYGYFMNKMMALMTMSEAQTFFVARDTAEDIRMWSISYFDDYADQILDLVGGILSEDYSAIAPYLVPGDGVEPPRIVHRDYLVPELDPRLEDQPEGTMLVDPITGFTLQLYTAVLGFGRFHTNFDNRFVTYSRMWLEGGDNGLMSDWPKIYYTDPETGNVYVAVARPDGRGISQRMLVHANRLRSRSSWCNRTDPSAPDACQVGVSPAAREIANRETLLYRDQLDVMVHLTARYDNWTFSYGGPLPGDGDPDW